MAASLAALFQVALVVLFGAPKGLGCLNPGDDGLIFETIFRNKLGDFVLRLGELLWRMEEDGGAVLRTLVGALAVEGGGVVEGKKSVQKLIVANLGGVKINLDHLGMACGVGADILVAGALKGTALIADGSGGDAGKGGESSFNSPEAACAESRFLCAHVS